MSNQTNQNYHEDQLTKLRYTKDIRDVMNSMPNVNDAPQESIGFALNVNDGEHFGTWQWLNEQPSVGYVYFQAVKVCQEA